MWAMLKEHFQEFAADIVIKRVVPSIVAAWVASLTRHLHFVDDGRPIFSEQSVQAITALAIMGAHYVIHLWTFLKRRAAEAQERRNT